MDLPIILKFLKGLAILVVPALVVGWFIVRSVRKSPDPRSIRLKWVITLGLVFGVLFPLTRLELSFGAAFIIPVTCAAVGLVLSILWGPHIAAAMAKPLTAAIDGGSQEYEARAFYSIATTRRKMGKYSEAITCIREQLEKFPGDFEGEMLLAAIHAEDQKDVESASTVVQRIVNRGSTPPNHLAGALNALADWHLRIGQDPEGARMTLEQIAERLPETEYANNARERIAHLADPSMLLSSTHRPAIVMKEGVKRIGLSREPVHVEPAEAGPAERARALVDHLTQHPDDSEAREDLARIYSDEFQRPEMAVAELETLIARPHQPVKRVVHWLNVIADVQVKQMSDVPAAAATLQRIVDMGPELAAAESARGRIARLKLERRGQQKSTSIAMGEYEQRLGLRKGSPSREPGSQ